MSDFHAIDLVGTGMRELLFENFTFDDEVGQFFPSIDVIKLASPTETAQQQSDRLSVFLYQITEDPYLKNRPPVSTDSVSRMRPPPMALRFHYLLTPFGPSPQANALIVGKILETLYDNSTLQISDPISEQTENVRIVFETLSIEELGRVWEALNEPYRMSLAYQLRVPSLESRRERVAVPVGEAGA